METDFTLMESSFTTYCSSRRASGNLATTSMTSRTHFLPSALKGSGMSTRCVQLFFGDGAYDTVKGAQEATWDPKK